jgi:hypothetical protein
MKPAQIYVYTVPAGGVVSIPVEGSFFKIISSTGPVSVGGDAFGTIGPILAGQGLKDEKFRGLQVQDASGQINVVKILIADRGFVDDRVTGEVSVIDGGKARTYGGGAFLASVNIGPVAAQLSHLQLFNPAGSGKNVILSAFSVSSATSGLLVIGRYNVPLTTSLAVTTAVNKLAGGAAGVSQLRSQNSVGNLIVGSPMYLPNIAASTTFVCNLKEPFLIIPGTGIVLEHNSVNTDLAAGFEFYEEPL